MKWHIHIGPNKTATTSIQAVFANSRVHLKQKGILYPESGCVSNAHHIINFSFSVEFNSQAPMAEVFSIDHIPKIDEIIANIKSEAEANGCANVILSSETFWRWRELMIKRLREVLGDDEVTIIMALRPSLERELSMWQEEVKHGYVGTVIDYLRIYSDTAKSSTKAPYYDVARVWKSCGFNLRVIPFMRCGNNNIWDLLLREIYKGDDIKLELHEAYDLNTSIDYMAIATMQKSFLKAMLQPSLSMTRIAKDRLFPVHLAVNIRDLAINLVKRQAPSNLPAYIEFFKDEQHLEISENWSELFMRDITLLENVIDIECNFDILKKLPSLRVINFGFEEKQELLKVERKANEISDVVIDSIIKRGNIMNKLKLYKVKKYFSWRQG